MKIFRSLILMLSFLGVCASVFASIQPSFSAEDGSWRANDIVVVTEGTEIDGIVQVIETWKGELRPGAILSIPELASFKAKDKRLVDNGPRGILQWWPQYVTEDRMVLFLRDRTKLPANSEGDPTQTENEGDEETPPRWFGASSMDQSVRYSTVWIERGKAYYFIQLMNPGPSLLCATSMTESELKKTTNDVTSEQNDLNLAVGISDPAVRAECLRSFFNSSLQLAREAAFERITECGTAALPILSEELDNDQDLDVKGDVAEALAKTGGTAAGPYLTNFLSKELEFWKHTAPTLDPGWWNGEGRISQRMDTFKPVEPLRDRWEALVHAIYALRAIRYVKSAEIVASLSDFWRSLPQMSNDSVSEACDDYFKTPGLSNTAPRHLRLPAYEIHFEGNRAFSSEELTRKMAEFVASFDKLKMDCGDSINRGILNCGIDQLINYVSDQGYLDARFSITWGTSAAGEVIDVKLNEGKRYCFGETKIEGTSLLSADQIRALSPIRTGDIAKSTLIRKWQKELELLYHNQGYLNCSVWFDHEARPISTPESAAARDGLTVADLKLEVSEGPQFTVEGVRFQGMAKVPERQLSTAISLGPGDKFTQDKLGASIKKVNREFGLSLDETRNVELSTNDARGRVNILICLDQDCSPKDGVIRGMSKRKWYL